MLYNKYNLYKIYINLLIAILLLGKEVSKMDLASIVGSYVGGQMEVQNPTEGYLYRGEIGRIGVNDNELQVGLRWVAKGEGFPPTWIKDDKRYYAASLEIYQVSEIGEERICLYSPVVDELVVFFPKSGSRLDPSVVAGLESYWR
jgi:hypothetical protein